MGYSKKYALVAAGEFLADLIGEDFASDLLTTGTFRRVQGGSPANLAANLARLGHKSALVACVGADSLGKYLLQAIYPTGVNTEYVAIDPGQPTSLVLVSRTQGTPDFIAYRAADYQLQPDHFPNSLLNESAIFHTTCFGLSREPARSSLLDAARRARQSGALLSLDANYAPSIWPDRHEALEVIGKYIQDALVKLSDDDAERIFGSAVTPEQVLDFLHGKGARLVCYTLGARGSLISWEGGRHKVHVAVEPVEVLDATGAGDAYWAGFLSAYLDGYPPAQCTRAGGRIAAIKISSVAPLPNQINRNLLYE
ncbi:carbohydrate kinase family protein [Salmonirosea aquatica]|uniref:Carbohydrate kinase n=1 Tax=Salmonirosea aquatica TaxID=2654236 RepID=A0A7C9F5J5_9BACT|nr:carbohydrate kinase [Cytophagaceae bacterium SJW1-29]